MLGIFPILQAVFGRLIAPLERVTFVPPQAGTPASVPRSVASSLFGSVINSSNEVSQPSTKFSEILILLPKFTLARRDPENHTESETLSICCSTTGNRWATWFASRNAAVTASGCSPDMRKALITFSCLSSLAVYSRMTSSFSKST